MKKYLEVFNITLQQEFAYKINFIMWRIRNVLQIVLVFYLWDSVFSDPGRVVFGYTRASILTYVFFIMVVKAMVISTRSMEVAGEIANGDLSNYLLKPISYIKYWLTRDFSSKAINLIFAVGETIALYFLLKPEIFFQSQAVSLFAFLILIVVAMLTFFLLVFITSMIPFWAPEMGSAGHFLVTVIAGQLLSGSIFPLDILPVGFQKILSFTPFPYLIFFPIQVYLGRVQSWVLVKGLMVSVAWLIVLWILVNKIWKKGLTVYQAYGR